MSRVAIAKVWEATKAAGMWFVLVDDDDTTLWEAWAWEGQQQPPKYLHQEGYRFQRCGESPSGISA